jgi:hypothetical protein
MLCNAFLWFSYSEMCPVWCIYLRDGYRFVTGPMYLWCIILDARSVSVLNCTTTHDTAWVSKWVSKWVVREYMYTIWETRTYKEITPLINQSFMTKKYLSATNTLTHIITSRDHNELRGWWVMYTVSFITFYCTTLNCTALHCFALYHVALRTAWRVGTRGLHCPPPTARRWCSHSTRIVAAGRERWAARGTTHTYIYTH